MDPHASKESPSPKGAGAPSRPSLRKPECSCYQGMCPEGMQSQVGWAGGISVAFACNRQLQKPANLNVCAQRSFDAEADSLDETHQGRPTIGFLELGSPIEGALAKFSDTLDYAKQIEAHGFEKIWLTEHQAPDDCWSSPQLPMALIARETRTLGVGTAGVLLKAHNPLRVASDFCFLEHNFRGRIDLGIARGTPTASGNRTLLVDDWTDAGLDAKIRLLVGLLSSNAAEMPPMTYVLPLPVLSPRIWLLGSGTSGISLGLAKQLAVKYIHSLFFQSSSPVPQDKILSAIAVAGFCGESKAEIEAFKDLYSGPFTPSVVDSSDECAQFLIDVAAKHDLNEVIFLDLHPELSGRLRNVAALAESFRRLAEMPAVGKAP